MKTRYDTTKNKLKPICPATLTGRPFQYELDHHHRMNVTAQQTEFLSWKVVPARLDANQAAWFLGFEPHEIPRLVTAGLLKPLGHPARNSTKFFATETLEQFRHDEKWLARASDAIASYWRGRNARKQQARGRA